MKRFLIFPCVLCLIIGLLVGVLLPIDLWGDDAPPLLTPNPSLPTQPPFSNPAESSGSSSASQTPEQPLDTADNFPLLNTACVVNRALQRGDWSTLAAYVHPDRGVTFTPTPPWTQTAI